MDVPDDWTPEHSVAALLVGMSMIDGDVDSQEMRALVDTLRGFPGIAAEDSTAVGRTAYSYLYGLQESGADIVGALRGLGAELGMHYEQPTLESIYERLQDMAKADGEVHPMEARMLHAFRLGWDLD